MTEKIALSKEEILEAITNLSTALGNPNHSDGQQLIVARLYDRCIEYLGVDLDKKSEAETLLKEIQYQFNRNK